MTVGAKHALAIYSSLSANQPHPGLLLHEFLFSENVDLLFRVDRLLLVVADGLLKKE